MEKITPEQLAEYVSLRDQKQTLERQARALERSVSALADHFRLHVEASGRESITRHGYRLSLVEGRPSVPWKDKFIALAGPLAAERALAEAPRPRKLQVEEV